MRIEQVEIYPNSWQKHGGSDYCMTATDAGDMLQVSGPDKTLFEGELVSDIKKTQCQSTDKAYKLCPLTVENSKIIRELFDFTRPKSHKGHDITIGLGDRLGLASAGHIRTIKDLDVFPVLAQQSMRELNLTGRTYADVLSSATWAVFREGYIKGYGADGDHLKTHEEIKTALDSGYTMITLDCSEHIPLGLDAVVKFTADVFNRHIRGKNIDFELSVDETQTVTTLEDHRYIARALKKEDVDIVSLAPRFCGEFQKGIDYIGDIRQFEKELEAHVKIADEYGYKISIHSGSDKFSIFPVICRLTGGRYHLKTAGTSWLEAVRVIATYAPSLYRQLHTYALENLPEARKYYHISCDLSKIAALDDTPDSRLPGYLNENDARQVLHITYGLMLQSRNGDGTLRFRDRIYRLLNEYEPEYISALEKHIGQHLTGLGIKKTGG